MIRPQNIDGVIIAFLRYLIRGSLATIAAFWSSYFGKLGSAPVGHHLHGITSTLWMLLLIWQSWTIHNRKRSQHALAGKSSFVLAPYLLLEVFG